MSEFPEELIERCAESVRETEDGRIPRRIVEAVLRESGHAELVAALKKATAAVAIQEQRGGTHWKELLLEIEAAIRKAGAL